MDLIFGLLISGVLLFSVVLDLAFVGLIIAFFVLALAYMAGCDSLRKGAKEE